MEQFFGNNNEGRAQADLQLILMLKCMKFSIALAGKVGFWIIWKKYLTGAVSEKLHFD